MAFGKITDDKLVLASNVIYDGENTYINPSDEQYIELGYKEVVYHEDEVDEYALEESDNAIDVYNNVVTLESVRAQKHKELDEYDASPSVNEFEFNGIPMWLTPVERNQLLMTLNAAKLVGKTDISVVHNGQLINLNVDNAIMLIYMIEDYARECAVHTAESHDVIDKLLDKQALREFDFTEGYPEKIRV